MCLSTWPGLVPKPYSIEPGYERPLYYATHARIFFAQVLTPFLTHREVSAQEAVYRTLDMPRSRLNLNAGHPRSQAFSGEGQGLQMPIRELCKWNVGHRPH